VWDFISDNRADFGAKRLRQVLELSRSGFYRHQETVPARAERRAAEEQAVTEIRAIRAEHHGAHGDITYLAGGSS
jgi:hypothetical protein